MCHPPLQISKPKHKLPKPITLPSPPPKKPAAAKRKPEIVPISADSPTDEEPTSPVKEKKKKRKLGGGTKPDFSWSSGTGEGGALALELSPIKGKTAPLPSRLR